MSKHDEESYMNHREADFTTLFRHWLRANPMPSAAFELKYSPTNALPFNGSSSVKPHQIDALLAAQTKRGLLYKPPDDSRGVKPCDLLLVANATSYVVICYPTEFHVIPIESYVHEKESSTRQSLTSERARAIADISVITKAP